jgi:hypothetical protein
MPPVASSLPGIAPATVYRAPFLPTPLTPEKFAGILAATGFLTSGVEHLRLLTLRSIGSADLRPQPPSQGIIPSGNVGCFHTGYSGGNRDSFSLSSLGVFIPRFLAPALRASDGKGLGTHSPQD